MLQVYITAIVLGEFLSFTMPNCIDVYAVLERANDRKLHVFATKHEANTYSEHLIHSHEDISI